VELKVRSYEKIVALVNKGASIPNPLTLDIGDEVDTALISGNGVTIFPGCRIYGRGTVISSGTKLGSEGPVTVDDCQIGPNVELKGGYFNKAVFLEKSNMGLGAHVREGCILEEEAGGAHCVGLKQTILFPFVTLGSLINFCDCLMAGGTSREDHSEVGSSYIHFNFTPDGDKIASLVGDVPRGVMLNKAPIFLGGQGGMVGPRRVGFGNTIAAGTVLRQDVSEENKLVFGKGMSGEIRDRSPNKYPSLDRVIGNTVLYLANLAALEQWYLHVRQPFFMKQEFGDLVFAGAMDKLSSAKEERLKRFQSMAKKAVDSIARYPDRKQFEVGVKELHAAADALRELFSGDHALGLGADLRQGFLAAVQAQMQGSGRKYIEFIKGLSTEASKAGTRWLEAVVSSLCSEAQALMPSLEIINK